MIYCIGDSLTYGDELPDAEYGPSQYAWPSLLGQKLNRPVTNLGRRGCGNTRIVKRVIDTAYKEDSEMIIIAWTGPQRIELFNNFPFDIWPGKHNQNTSANPLIKHITANYTHQYDSWAYRKWLRDVILTQNLLENQNKKYLMAVSWHTWTPRNECADLFSKVKMENFLGITGNQYETFGHWIEDAPVGPNNHPLELGHQRITEKIYEHIRNIGWLS